MTNNLTAESLTEQTAKILPFPSRPLNDYRTSVPSSGGAAYISGTDIRSPRLVRPSDRQRFDTDVFGALQARDREIFNLAFDRISHALDTQFDTAELSNVFDEWKDTLEAASRKIESLTSSHRKIIGMLLSLLKGKDISDFNKESLRIFREATNTLRSPRIVKQDARRIIEGLVKDGKRIMMPLSVNESNTDKTNYLEGMMDQLLATSREDL